jgi:hypothetical protein
LSFVKELAAKEKLEISSGAAPPPFRIFAGGLPCRLRRRNAFGLIQEYRTIWYNKYMDLLNIVNAIIVSIGLPIILGAAIYIGKKLQILDDLKYFRDKFPVVESRMNDLWADKVAPARSPRQLNERGETILRESGIRQIIDSKKEILLEKVKETNPQTAYDAEIAIMNTVAQLPTHCPDTIRQLKEGAFKAGTGIDTILYVGGIHLRDISFESLGFQLHEIDNHTAFVQK